MAQQKGPGLGKKIGKMAGYLFIAALVWALLRQFDLDPFAVVGWAWNHLVNLINYLSDVIMGNRTFQKATEAPGLINIFRIR